MRNIITLLVFIGCLYTTKAAVFESSGVTNNYSAASSWNLISGSSSTGYPGLSDDATILSGHTISLSQTSYAKTLTINSGGTFVANNKYIQLRGSSLINNGTISGSLYIQWFFAPSASISSVTSLSIAVLNINYATSLSVPAGLSINVTNLQIRSGSTLTNSGTITASSVSTVGSSGNTLNNLNGSSFTLQKDLVNNNLTINNNASSTFTLGRNVTSIPNCTYNNLILMANGGTKTASSTLNITGNLTVGSSTTIDASNNNQSLAGNLSNSGTISNLGALTLNGTSNQNISTSSALSPTSLTISNTSTITLTSGIVNVPADVTIPGALTISGGTLNLNSHTINLAGNLLSTGTISNLSNANFNGTTAQTISSSQSLAFNDLTTSNAAGVTFTSGSHSITNSLTVASGNLDVGSSLVTLVSNDTKTAYIDVASSGGTISGTMIVQRNITAQAANSHDLSSPVNSTTMADWDDELFMSIGAPDDTPGYPGGDGSSAGGYSVYTYDETTSTWNPVTTGATTAINKGIGYDVYVADDPTSFPGRAIDSRGTPNMSDVTVAVTNSVDGWNLLGNPFACHINWNSVVSANSLLSSTIQTLQSGNYADIADPTSVPPGQGFFAVVTGAGNITIPASAGLTSTSSSMDRAPLVKNYDVKLRLSSSVNPYIHEIKIVYNDATSKGFDNGKDVTYIKSPLKEAPYMTFVDGGKKFTRNNINTSSNIVTMPLEIKTPISGNYIIDAEGIIGSSVYDAAYIIDNSTQEQYDLNDGKSVTLYFDNNEIHNNYSVVLMKTNANLTNAFTSDQNVTIFATSENINIKGNLSNTVESAIEVYNLMGQLVIKTSGIISNNNPILIPTAELKSEVYIVTVTSPNNEQFTKKVVITK